jgi:NAD(P)-dependent dehydrogenase (short-subunit alcohol dehydrogenase family)
LFRLDGKVAIVTGGTRGIGRAIALSLAQAGAHLMLVYRTNDESAEAAAKEVGKFGGRVVLLKGDVGEVKRRFGQWMAPWSASTAWTYLSITQGVLPITCWCA